MKLSKILERLEYTCLQGTLDQEIEEVVADSRKAKEGSLFICIRGAVVDGHTFAKSVAGAGNEGDYRGRTGGCAGGCDSDPGEGQPVCDGACGSGVL